MDESGISLIDSAWRINEFLEHEFPKPRQIIGPVGNGALVLIAAATGIGKTQLAVGMTHAITTGQPFLGMHVDEPGSVLHIDGEMQGADLQMRFRGYEWTGTKRMLVFRESMLAGGGLVNLAEEAWQAEVLSAAEHFDVIKLDNVYSLVNVPGQTMSSDIFWRTVEPMNNALRSMDKSVFWYDHTNHAGAVFGTKTKEWQMDLTALLTPHGSREKGVTKFDMQWDKVRGDGSGLDNLAIRVTMRTVNGKSIWHWEPIDTKEEKREKIMDALEEGYSYQRIADTLGVSKREISSVKKEMSGR